MISLPAIGFGPYGKITRISSSPGGRSIDLTYDALARITEATDNLGRIVSYTYDASGRLAAVRDANGGMSEYTYGTGDRMETLKNPRGVVYLTNQYYGPGPHEGRVQRQTRFDNTYFEYVRPTRWGARRRSRMTRRGTSRPLPG
jgi:YD repeat-containing protein